MTDREIQRNIVTKISVSRSDLLRGRMIVDVQIRGIGAGFLVVPIPDVKEIVERLSRPADTFMKTGDSYIVFQVSQPDGTSAEKRSDRDREHQTVPDSGERRPADCPF